MKHVRLLFLQAPRWLPLLLLLATVALALTGCPSNGGSGGGY